MLAGERADDWVFWIVVTALLITGYAMAQKQLLQMVSPEGVMFLVYVFGGILLTPLASPGDVLGLTLSEGVLLVLSALITLVSYVSFAASMRFVEMSRVSMVLALNPLIILGNMALVTALFPGFVAPERLTGLSWVGAALVVVGSILGASCYCPRLREEIQKGERRYDDVF